MESLFPGLSIGLLIAFAGFVSLLQQVFVHVARIDAAMPLRFAPREARLTRKILSAPDNVLGSLMAGYFFCVLVAGIGMARPFLATADSAGLAGIVTGTASFLWLLTRVLPQAYMRKQDDEFALMLVPCLYVVAQLLSPLSLLLGRLRNGAVWLIFRTPAAAAIIQTGDYTLLHQAGAASPAAPRDAVATALQHMAGLQVRDVLTPLAELETLDAAMPVDEILQKVFASKAQRLVMIQDSPEMILGILHTRLLMKSFCQVEGDHHAIDITSAISEPSYIDADRPLLDQLRAFIRQNEHFALVRGQDGVAAGAVSLEKILARLSGWLD